MYLTRLHFILAGGWFALLAIGTGLRTAAGTALTLEVALGLLAMAVVPAAILVVVFRGAPPRTIAQVLYDAEHTANPTRDRLRADKRAGAVR